MSQLNIVVLGGSGFVGRLLVKQLAEQGHRLTVLSRNLSSHPERLLPPGVTLREMDVYDAEALRQALAGADVVVNLVGILNESGDDGSGFRHAHVELTRRVIDACKSNRVRRLLQMSSLNAGRGSSHYLHSRGEAEASVKASGLDWTIFEPSVIFGTGDGLFTRFAALIKYPPALPLACADAKFAPVYVGDVVEAFSRSLRDRGTIGEVYELYGPDVFTLKQIVQMTAQQLGLKRLLIPLPDFLGRIQGLVCDFVPGKPFSSDNFRSLQTDSVGGIDGLHRLGIVPTRVAQVLPDLLGNSDDRQTRLARYRAAR
ncbi:MAG: complex I NDUFA9 subunit family protein [Arenimonas sp.]|nr:complex I NDUFA9 subunit family protein [Arenimonas sp.]